MASLGLVAVVVDDYDRAIDHYTNDVGFVLVDDVDQGNKRWVVVAPPGSQEDPMASHILLAEASAVFSDVFGNRWDLLQPS